MTPKPIMILAALFVASAAPASRAEPDFYILTDQAMQRMMDGMHVPLAGNVDRDFTTMMIPHHRGAVDMAIAELRYGTNPQLKRIAQEIIVTQQQEIAAMQVATGGPLPPLGPAPTQQRAHEPNGHIFRCF